MKRVGERYRRWTLALLVALTAATGLSAQVVDDDPEFPITPDSVLLRPDSSLLDRSLAAPIDTPPAATLGLPQLSDSRGKQVDAAVREPCRPDPIRALWLSLVLPGAGQIYNHKYWKLPIIYGGFLGCAYALSWNNQMLSDYSQAYLDIMDNDPNSKSYEKMLPMGYDITGREEQFKTIFKNKKNYYRKYRDMSIFAFAAVYAIAAIDAYVDAELSTFDISEDLSMRIVPTIISSRPDCGSRRMPSLPGDAAAGFSLQMTF